MQEARRAGAALQTAFERRGCALSADEARALVIALRDQIAAGLLVPSDGSASRPTPGSEPNTAPRSGVVGSGTRAVGRGLTKTAHAYNMGSLSASDSDSE